MSEAYITINGRKIGVGYPVYIIAEIGINHNGSLELALDMIRAAKQCGADAVKFQILTSDRCYTRQSPSYEIFRKIEFKKLEWKIIFDLASSLGIDCFATFVDRRDIVDFSEFTAPAVKVSSSNVTNIPLLESIAQLGVPVLLSSGMSELSELKEAVDTLRAQGQKEIAIFQCTSLYPAPLNSLNLRVIGMLRTEFPDCPIGFSDHSQGILGALTSVALGATLIEKHFTIDRALEGPDQCFSSNPREMTELVEAVRGVEAALGSSVKAPTSEERAVRGRLRRTIVALRNISPGEILSEENIGLKRSNTFGLEPKHYRAVLGRKVKSPLKNDMPLQAEMVESESV